jgi:hypothetical protein
VLSEYDCSKTIAAMGTRLADRAHTDGVSVDHVVLSAEQSDPTHNQQYVTWILRQYTKNGLELDQFDSLTEPLQVFDSSKAQHRRLNIVSDINRYDWRTINDVVLQINSTEVDSERANRLNIANTRVLYNGPLGVLAIPETESASCELGTRTRWCTAATRSDNRFDQYNSQGPLHVWIDQKTKNKFQFHFETFQFMDQLNQPLGTSELLHFARQHPVIKKLFASKQSQIDRAAEEYIDYITAKAEYEQDPDTYRDEYGDFEENANWDEIEPDALFTLADPEVIQQNLKYIKQDPHLSYYYAKNIAKHAWPQGEKAIMSDAWYAVAYAQHVLKSRWPEAETRIARTAGTDNYYRAVQYAQNVIQGRWPEAEKLGMYNTSFVLAYAEHVLKSRWPEAEAKFNAGSYGYNRYAIEQYLDKFDITVQQLNTTPEQKLAISRLLATV